MLAAGIMWTRQRQGKAKARQGKEKGKRKNKREIFFFKENKILYLYCNTVLVSQIGLRTLTKDIDTADVKKFGLCKNE